MPIPTLAPELKPLEEAAAAGDELEVADVEAVLAEVVNRVAALVVAAVAVAAVAEAADAAAAASSAVMLK